MVVTAPSGAMRAPTSCVVGMAQPAIHTQVPGTGFYRERCNDPRTARRAHKRIALRQDAGRNHGGVTGAQTCAPSGADR